MSDMNSYNREMMKKKNQRLTKVVTFERVMHQMGKNRKAANTREEKLKTVLKRLKNLDKVKVDQHYQTWKQKEKEEKREEKRKEKLEEKKKKEKPAAKKKFIEYIVL